jgi:ribosomal protein L29
MKKAKLKEELKSLNEHELKEKIEILRRERLNLIINAATAHVKDYSQFKRLHKDIARALTYLKQKQKVHNK